MGRGSRVVIRHADVADYSLMKKNIFEIEKNYGSVNGIFHLAGIPGKGLTTFKEVDTIRSVLSPKIQGTWVLAQLFGKKKLDFFVSASSLTAIVGGIGQIDYCAANIFIDSFMESKPLKNCQKYLTINWNAWSTIGMAANLTDSKTHSQLYEANCISPKEGTHIIEKLFLSDYSHVIVSRFSPEAEYKRIISTFSIDKLDKKIDNNYLPHLSKVGIYECVAEAWREVLGVKDVKKDDNFYLLGGDSLLAIELLVKIQQRFNIKISLQDLAHAPTLNLMTKLVEYRPIQTEQVIIPLFEYPSKKDFQKTIYFIHPLGGTILSYFPIISYLKDTFAYYAIQDPELMRSEDLFNSIQEMAIYYANQVYQHQGDEKTEIILIGASFGGNIAIEMAAELKENILMLKR